MVAMRVGEQHAAHVTPRSAAFGKPLRQLPRPQANVDQPAMTVPRQQAGIASTTAGQNRQLHKTNGEIGGNGA